MNDDILYTCNDLALVWGAGKALLTTVNEDAQGEQLLIEVARIFNYRIEGVINLTLEGWAFMALPKFAVVKREGAGVHGFDFIGSVATPNEFETLMRGFRAGGARGEKPILLDLQNDMGWTPPSPTDQFKK